jgi:ABC-type Fe3+ transport system permease subunit
MKRFLEWWILFLLQLSGLGISYYFDLFQYVYTNDITKLSFVILLIWFIFTIKCGINAYQYDKNKILRTELNQKFESGWFASDQCLSIGMLGTVIGFLIMMGSMNITNTEARAVQEMLKTMSLGMATALITTAVGMIFGNLIKLQLFLISRE